MAIISVMALTCTLALDGAFARSGPVSSLSRSYKVVRIMTGPHIPSGPVWIGDLGLVANGRFYFADISNDQVDVFSTHRLRFVGAVPGFMLPSAVAAVGHAIWASNGDSTVKIVGPGRLRIRASVSTRGKSRADDLAWDPVDDTVIVVNSGDQPPFLSFVNARTRRVAGRLSLRSATDVGQPIWDPVARLFFVPVTVAKAGEVVGVSPTSHRVVRKFHIPCAPSGFVLGPRQEAALACDTRALIVDLGRRGRIVKSFPTLGGGDQVAYDSGLERYYMTAAVHTASASIAVVDAVTRRQLTSWRVGTLTHSLGVDSVTHRVFVPGSTGVVVYSPGG